MPGDRRAVTADQYRRFTTLSSLAGVAALASGLWFLFRARFVLGIVLIALGLVLGMWTGLLRIDGTPAALHKRVEQQTRWSPRVMHFYTRQECSLCEEALVRLRPVLEQQQISLVEHDVDLDPVLRERFGSRVPVAVYEGVEVFALEYDEAAVRALR